MGAHLLLTPQVMQQPSPLVSECWILGIRPLRVTLSSWLLRFIATEVRLAVGLCLKLLSSQCWPKSDGSFWAFISQVLQDLLLQTDRVLFRVWHVGQGVPEILVRCLLLCSALLIYWRGSRDDRLHHQDFRWCLIFLICCLVEGQFPPVSCISYLKFSISSRLLQQSLDPPSFSFSPCLRFSISWR